MHGNVKLGKQVCAVRCWEDVKHAREKGASFPPGVLPALLGAGSCQEEVELEGTARGLLPGEGG